MSDAMRDRLKGPLHEALHALEPRIPNLTVGDCHCNLLAEVALDALMPILAEQERMIEAATALVAYWQGIAKSYLAPAEVDLVTAVRGEWITRRQ